MTPIKFTIRLSHYGWCVKYLELYFWFYRLTYIHFVLSQVVDFCLNFTTDADAPAHMHTYLQSLTPTNTLMKLNLA